MAVYTAVVLHRAGYNMLKNLNFCRVKVALLASDLMVHPSNRFFSMILIFKTQRNGLYPASFNASIVIWQVFHTNKAKFLQRVSVFTYGLPFLIVLVTAGVTMGIIDNTGNKILNFNSCYVFCWMQNPNIWSLIKSTHLSHKDSIVHNTD